MIDRKQQAFQFLAPPQSAFWNWAADGEVITWLNGDTIVFRRELELILRCAPLTQLPPLGGILLVLAACGDEWDEKINLALNAQNTDSSHEILDGLQRIGRLSPGLRQPLEAKGALIAFLFEHVRATVPALEPDTVCNALHSAAPSFCEGLQRSMANRPEKHENFQDLVRGLARFDPPTFQLRQSTGLDQLLWPARIDLKRAEESRSLIAKLDEEDRELPGVVGLTRSLMAVVHLPRAIADPEDLPLGGVSDITNRGSVDRLLVSELAFDDLTLAVRLALNEVLYLRRESPPKTPTQSRAILIDCGIRMWGVPRVFAASVALAIAATAEQRTVVTASRAQGVRLVDVDLTSREGLIDLLGALESELHPGRALEEFFHGPGRQQVPTDWIIVTHADSANDREFCRILRQYDVPALYLATVDGDGEFEMTRQTAHGRKPVCRATLDLQQVLARHSAPATPLMTGNDDLPAIMKLAEFPLRIPDGEVNARQGWFVADVGFFEISRRRRLLLWDESDKGPVQLKNFLASRAPVRWSDPRCRNGNVCAVLGNPYASKTLFSYNVNSSELNLVPLGSDHLVEVGFQGVLICCRGRDVQFLSSLDGTVMGTFRFPDSLELQANSFYADGRFFRERDTDAWYALSYDGRGGRLERIIDATTQRQYRIIEMFDWIEHEGPVGITSDGLLFFPEDKSCRPLIDPKRGDFVVNEISSSGSFIKVQHSSGNLSQMNVANLVNVSSAAYSGIYSVDSPVSRAIWLHERFRRRGLRRKFKGIVADKEFGLALVSRKGSSWRILLRDGKIRLDRSSQSADELRSQLRQFDRMDWMKECGFYLFRVKWPDGRCAWLDSRGLLHLRSSMENCPELTLVLTEDGDDLAGWCSDGRSFGSSYFLRDDANSDAGSVFEPFIRLFTRSSP